jgi:hypothetical protein
MQMSDNHFKSPVHENLIDFLSIHLGVKKEFLIPSTRIQEDLGCTGDDAVELMHAFSEKFNVDLCEFNPNEYFDSESFDPIGYLLSLFRKGQKVRSNSITLQDLEDAAKLGKWTRKK